MSAQRQINTQFNSDLNKNKEIINELKEQNRDLMEQLQFTEGQLIQVKSSWAESEHEREQLFNQVDEYEEQIQALREQIDA